MHVGRRRAGAVVAVAAVLAAVAPGCAGDRLADQRAAAWARTCASLVERRHPEQLAADPVAAYAELAATSGPDAYREASRDDGSGRPRRSGVRELLAGCHTPGG